VSVKEGDCTNSPNPVSVDFPPYVASRLKSQVGRGGQKLQNELIFTLISLAIRRVLQYFWLTSF